ncbi:ADP-ribosylation factor-like protein 6-interacting protein 6 isoform X2 [Siniperca chuatsi]|uniref:ADP-ribosylation factor-like protein 6-interacting protein 6 isoform X2 n=1 Tax=Siniperca chuatsi TaxID=119488 RepID=UPI001CE08234|nr:ADP-ribosylation factor-like protein 6-interacting protein 6 isoform X2 [Siniperca chuatsi]
MPRAATDMDVIRESFGRSYSSEDMEHAESHSWRPGVTVISREGPGGSARRPFTNQNGPKPWSVVVLSVMGSAVAVAAVGCFCALIYPILKGFWSILVLSVLVGCICCVFSWTLTYLDSYQPGMVFPTPLTLAHFRDVSGHGFHMSYGVAVLNGIMAILTVIWSLT